MDSITTSIDERIAELQTELATLTEAREALAGVQETIDEPEVDETEDDEGQDDLKAQRIANLKKAREAKAAKAKANGKGGKSKRPQIAKLLKAGKKPSEIAKALDVSQAYVYNTKNWLASQAA